MRFTPAGDGLVAVFRTNQPLETHAIRDLLTGNGVPAMSRWTGMPPGLQNYYAPDQTRAEVCVYYRDLELVLAVFADNKDEAEFILSTSLPEPSVATFEWRNLLGAGRGVRDGLTATAMLCLFPLLLLIEIPRWLRRNIAPWIR